MKQLEEENKNKDEKGKTKDNKKIKKKNTLAGSESDEVFLLIIF